MVQKALWDATATDMVIVTDTAMVITTDTTTVITTDIKHFALETIIKESGLPQWRHFPLFSFK